MYMKYLGMFIFVAGVLVLSMPELVLAEATEQVAQTQYIHEDGLETIDLIILKAASPVTLATVMLVFIMLAGLGAYVAFGIILMFLFVKK